MSTTIFDLPTEMIAHIFSFVSHKKDRRNLALICKQFHKIVREQSKKHNRIDRHYSKKSSLSIFHQCDEFPFQKLSLGSEDIGQYRGLWQKHGAEITQMTFYCNSNDLGTFGNELKELFPNLKSLDFGLYDVSELRSTEVKHFFSENIKYLELCCDDEEWKHLGSYLELFPGLNHLNLTIHIMGQQNDSEVQEFKDILDKWLPQLEKIEFSFNTIDDVQLLEAFEGLIDEKLSFENFTVEFTQRSINILKNFFSVSRHVVSLEIYEANAVPDSTLCALIEKNARIDRLTLFIHEYEKDGYLANLRYLINAPGVKEINVSGDYEGSVSLDDCLHFSPEALLKVKEIAVCIDIDESVFMIPLFRNLRKLKVIGGVISNDELAFIVHNFPQLEDLIIPYFNVTNGRLLTHLKCIRSLAIGGTPSLLNAFFKFGAQLPNLETLRLSEVPNITWNGVKSIVANCPMIREIVFNKCPKISEKCLHLVAQKLFYVEKISSDFDAEICRTLEKKYPELKFNTSFDWRYY